MYVAVPLLNCNLDMVERLAYSSDPESYAGWGFIPLTGSTTPDRSRVWVTKTLTNENQITHLVEEGAPAMGTMVLPSQTSKGAGKLTHLLTPKKYTLVGTWNIWTMLQAGKASITAKEMVCTTMSQSRAWQKLDGHSQGRSNWPVGSPLSTPDMKMRRRKWSWIGHTFRNPATNITQQALKWDPQGTRKRGHPGTAGEGGVQAEMSGSGLNWGDLERTTSNRVSWRTFVSGLCSLEE